MTAIEARVDPATAARRADLPPRRVLADIGILAQRNLRRQIRNTGLMVFSTIQPLMQLILFAYVFTAVVRIGRGIDYKDFVVPAVLVQSVTFTSMGSGVGVAYDLQMGLIDRFRALPIARSAFLIGRTVADSLRLGVQAVLLMGAALLIGFDYHAGILGLLGVLVVVVMFGIALTAFSTWIGLVIKDPETVQPAVFIPILPLVFTSSAFAPVDRLPGWMQPLAANNPITAAIDTARGLALGDDILFRVSDVHLSTAAWHFGVWWVAITGLFTWLAVRRYRRG